MLIRHDNPQKPRYDRKSRRQQEAHAPYNFLPLPPKVVPAEAPLPLDRFAGLSGWIEYELETCSPTYVRGMLTNKAYEAQGQKKANQLSEQEKLERADFFSTGNGEVEGQPEPAIPGSSLRGMTRALVEIAGHGHTRWVADEPTFTFRAVAAARDDPLRDPYQAALGRFGSEVRAGYLQYEKGNWYIQPAVTPQKLRLPERSGYLKVKEGAIGKDDIPGFVRFNQKGYRPTWYRVSVSVSEAQGSKGRYVRLNRIGLPRARLQHQGVLVCSGNMAETGGNSPRKNHALVLWPDGKVPRLPIPAQVVRDYIAGLSPYQRDELQAWGSGDGCLPRSEELNPKREKKPSFLLAPKGGRCLWSTRLLRGGYLRQGGAILWSFPQLPHSRATCRRRARRHAPRFRAASATRRDD